MSKKTPHTNASDGDADQALQDALNARADGFSKQFASATYEMGQAQNFIRELCGIYELNYLRSVDFERRVHKEDLSLIHISEPTDRTRSRMPSSA